MISPWAEDSEVVCDVPERRGNWFRSSPRATAIFVQAGAQLMGGPGTFPVVNDSATRLAN
jgi:hypothetical protein